MRFISIAFKSRFQMAAGHATVICYFCGAVPLCADVDGKKPNVYKGLRRVG